MKTYIINYFISERQGALMGMILSLVFVIASLFLWKRFPVASLQRGMARALLGAGSLFMVATAATVIHNNQRIARTGSMIITDEYAVQQMEIQRMEKVMARAYIGGLSVFTIALVTGAGLLLCSPKQTLKGLGIGLLLFGLSGISTELLSMKHNRRYLETIQQLDFSNKTK